MELSTGASRAPCSGLPTTCARAAAALAQTMYSNTISDPHNFIGNANKAADNPQRPGPWYPAGGSQPPWRVSEC